MSQQQFEQTVASEQEYLLTKEAYQKWINNLSIRYIDRNIDKDFRVLYLKEHGLPLDSIIEGL